ncbi:MAG: tetratricopeptide repeat protein [Chloroflexi bacterium]|nr:tetratricopeptide repeat protein [Chloroflexota bacterium]MCC6893034.1 tetratricopeptide repeat protein [Anaerolineae bacterium]
MAQFTRRLGTARYEADEYYQQALEAFRKRNYDTAINNMNDAIALQPRRSEFYAARGLFYLEDGVNDKAQADFQQALRLFPQEMLAHYGRGVIAYKTGNMEEALAHFSDAYKGDPTRPETLYYLAMIYHRQQQHETAKRLMEVGMNALPADDKRRGDFQKWLREFERLITTQAKPTAPKMNVMGKTDEPKLLE